MSFDCQNKQFIEACISGDLHFVKQLYHPSLFENVAELERIFRVICSCGHVELAQWLYQIYPNMKISYLQHYLFRHACSDGFLDLAQWIYDISSSCNIQACGNQAIRLACKNGHLAIMKWIYSKCPEIDLSMYSNEMLHEACIGGYQEIIEWILSHDKKEITKEPFLLLCKNGHFIVAQWFYNTYHFPFFPLEALSLSCENNNYEMIEWLLTKNTMECIPQFVTCFYSACKNGFVPIVQLFLHNAISVLTEEHLSQGFYFSCVSNHLDCSQLLLSKQLQGWNDPVLLLNICKQCCFLNYPEMLVWVFSSFHHILCPNFPFQEIMNELSLMSNEHVKIMKILFDYNPSCLEEYFILFDNACWLGNDSVAQWIIDNIPDVTAQQHKLFTISRERRQWRIALYLSHKYPDYYQVIIDNTPVITYIILTEINHTLPLKKYSNEITMDEHTCVICYETAQLFTNCNHYFCESCLEKSLQRHVLCAYCRQPIDHIVQPLKK